MRCILCSYESSQLNNQSRCQVCGTDFLKADESMDVEVRLNWLELKMLCMWAGHRADQIANEHGDAPELVETIAGRLQQQHPGLPTLTLRGDIAQARAQGIELVGEMPLPLGVDA